MRARGTLSGELAQVPPPRSRGVKARAGPRARGDGPSYTNARTRVTMAKDNKRGEEEEERKTSDLWDLGDLWDLCDLWDLWALWDLCDLWDLLDMWDLWDLWDAWGL